MYVTYNLYNFINLNTFNIGLNRGKSIQLALVRRENITMLYVNEVNSSVPVGYSLFTNYTSKPWINPELGI